MDKLSVPQRTTVDEEILLDAAAHPGRTYSEHVEAARLAAAAEYRAEIKRMMAAGTLDD